jgi:hypothetical protein
VRRAQDFVSGFKPLGGTAIGDALAAALRLRAGGGEAGGRSGRPYLVVFLTDGLPTVGETREEALVPGILQAGDGTRIFCFGIGTDVNTHLLDRIAEGSRALSRYVLPGEDLELVLSSFYSKIRDPVLADLALSFSNPKVRVSGLEPAALPDLFNGEVLAVFGRYSGSGAAEARITGSLGGKQVQFAAEVDFPAAAGEQGWIPRLWAARRVGRLLDEIRLRGESAELRDEVVALAREHGIVTPYTAYLVLEDEARRGVAPELRSFREMEQDREVSAAARGKLDSVRAEAKAPERRTGAEAVANAQSVLGLKNSRNAEALQEAGGLEKSGPGRGAGAGLQRLAGPQLRPGGESGRRPRLLPERDRVDRRRGPGRHGAQAPAGGLRRGGVLRAAAGNRELAAFWRWATTWTSSWTTRWFRFGTIERMKMKTGYRGMLSAQRAGIGAAAAGVTPPRRPATVGWPSCWIPRARWAG